MSGTSHASDCTPGPFFASQRPTSPSGSEDASARNGTSPIHTIPMSLPSRSSWMASNITPAPKTRRHCSNVHVAVVHRERDAVTVAGIAEATWS